jgi:hypothetical protein
MYRTDRCKRTESDARALHALGPSNHVPLPIPYQHYDYGAKSGSVVYPWAHD